MKPIDEMTGSEKSAVLLVALGPEVSSRVLAYLDERTVYRIAQEIIKIEDLTTEQKEDLIGEFILSMKKNKNAVFGGENTAKEMLESAFGSEKAQDILNKITHIDIEKGFLFLKNIDPDILSAMMEKEHPQTIAAALYYLSPGQNAKILKNLPVDLSKDIIKRMTKIEKPAPAAVLEIVRVLRNKYEKLRNPAVKSRKTDGINILIDILNHMNPDQEKKLINYFNMKLPDISSKIQDKLYVFDMVLNLTNREVQALIEGINDDYLIARALKGAGDEIRFKFLRNMSQNKAGNILNDMDNMGPVRLLEINEARNSIVRTMRMLDDNGVITIRKEDQMIE